uniref:Uncharacterized protein n=1 Tax=Colobus angolensis palliatus TaxID=336983 RepID=A0A2K5JDV1_COLAP
MASPAAVCGLRASHRVAPRWRITTTAAPSPPTPGAPRPPATPSPPPPPPPTTTMSLPPRGPRRAARAARGASGTTRAPATQKRMTGSTARRRPRILWGIAGTHPSTRSASASLRSGRSPETHCPSKRDALKSPPRAMMRR